MNRYLQIAPVAIAGLLWLSRIFLRDGGVGLVNGLVVFLITWWLVLFMTLPVGVRSQQENGEVIEGSEPGAPMATRTLRILSFGRRPSPQILH